LCKVLVGFKERRTGMKPKRNDCEKKEEIEEE
jgi:hypothetical protein